MFLMIGLIAAGAIAGGIIAYAMDMKSPKELHAGRSGRADRRAAGRAYAAQIADSVMPA